MYKSSPPRTAPLRKLLPALALLCILAAVVGITQQHPQLRGPPNATRPGAAPDASRPDASRATPLGGGGGGGGGAPVHRDLWPPQAQTAAQHGAPVANLSRLLQRAHSTGLPRDEQAKHPARLRRAQEAAPLGSQECEPPGSRRPVLFGIRSDQAEAVTDDGVIIVKASTPTLLYLIGTNLYSNISVALTQSELNAQDDCTHLDRLKTLEFKSDPSNLNIGNVTLSLPQPGGTAPLHFCLREADSQTWYHQGPESWLKIHVEQDFLNVYMKCILIACLLGLSGLFSGLNLGLMSLDKNELQVIMRCGSEDERRYARTIEPVRRRGNYLLCSILFANTLVNSTISVLLEELSDGLIAVISSTVLIVLFGEILPQAFCSRHGLAVGAKTVGLTYLCMFVTFPLSWPVSYCLDLALGEEIGHAYDRDKLMEFIKVTRNINNLEADEVNIISGALKIKQVTIREVMTAIDDVYMLDEGAVLDFNTIQAIVEKGYSRIPVHERGNKRNIIAVLFAKDLALVDPDDKTPVQTMIDFYNHPRMFVYEDTTLDKALGEFRTGKSHMAIVLRIVEEADKDPYYEVTGIVTLEDVIEEIIQMEINDETDTLTDNRKKRRRKEAQVRKDFSHFTNLGSGDSGYNIVSPQLCLAAYQYLATAVEPFSSEFLSDNILRRLLSQKIFYKVKADDDESVRRLYTAGEPADYFIMILEGRVHVVCGKEGLFFDGGPFSFFGKAALTNIDKSEATGAPEVEIPARRESSLKPALASHRDSSVSKLSKINTTSMAKINVDSIAMDTIATPKHTGTTAGEQPAAAAEPSYFTPDYTVTVTATSAYLRVTRMDYHTALKATLVEREGGSLTGGAQENEEESQFDSSILALGPPEPADTS